MPKTFLPESAIMPAILGFAAALAGCAMPGVTAAVHRDPVQLQKIVDQPNHGNENLDNLLVNSVNFDCPECVKLLLAKGAKPGVKLLSDAAVAGHETVAQLLIDSGADPAAAMSVIHDQTRKWAGGCCISPEQAQSASKLFKKIERQRAAVPGASVPEPSAPEAAASAAPVPAVVEAEPKSPRETPSFHEAEHPGDYALIVGIEAYDELPAAAYAGSDAAAVARFVKALGVPARNIVTLTGARATRAGLAKNLEGWLPDNVDEDSTVYFYFAGRGAFDPKSGLACLVPFDGDPAYLEQTAYPLKRLYQKLGALKARRVIVLLDAGFSGAGGRSVLAKDAKPRASGADAEFNSVDGKLALLAAADAGQGAGTSDANGHGLFSGYLFAGLNGAAKDASGQVTLKSLFDFLKPKVKEEARRVGNEQVPQFQSGGTATGHVVLRTK
jgi:hypothetical protein